MIHKVLAFMKATSLKPLWIELTETLTDTEGNRQKQTEKQTNKQTNYLHGAEPVVTSLQSLRYSTNSHRFVLPECSLLWLTKGLHLTQSRDVI
jgi:murein L,D-transpeptidase YcbB/YkuD